MKTSRVKLFKLFGNFLLECTSKHHALSFKPNTMKVGLFRTVDLEVSLLYLLNYNIDNTD